MEKVLEVKIKMCFSDRDGFGIIFEKGKYKK